MRVARTVFAVCVNLRLPRLVRPAVSSTHRAQICVRIPVNPTDDRDVDVPMPLRPSTRGP